MVCSTMTSPDHREFTRVRSAFPVVLETAGARLDGSTRDLSLNGALVSLPSPPPAGVTVRVEILLGGHGGTPTVRAAGTIARSGDGQCAVAFTELVGEESYHHLRRVILYNAEDPARVDQEFSSHLGLKRVDG
jgi:hypothetical protein